VYNYVFVERMPEYVFPKRYMYTDIFRHSLEEECVHVRVHVLQCVAVCCSVLQCVVVCCSVLQCDAVCCSVLQCVAVCCSVLQCVAVCCTYVYTCSGNLSRKTYVTASRECLNKPLI